LKSGIKVYIKYNKRVFNAELGWTKDHISFEGSVVECNLMEWSNISKERTIKKEMPLSLKPFEIKTFKFRK